MGCPNSPPINLNLNVRGLPLSATVAINERSNWLRGQGKQIYKLGLGQSPFPVPELVVEELRRNAHQKDYLPVRGLRELREAVAARYEQEFGVPCSPEQVLVGPGSKELMFILQLVYYGDLLIPTPAWVSYGPQAQIIGRHIRLLPTRPEHGWRISPEQLDWLCSRDPGRPRLLVLNYPSNPTGGSYDQQQLKDLAEVAQKHSLVLLSDEIYGRLHHQNAHTSLVPLYPSGTIFSSGLSKWCGAGGWRLGVFVVPACMTWLLESMATVASETFTSTSAPIQYAAVRAFSPEPELDRYVESCQQILGALGRTLAKIIRQGGVQVLEPEGGFYLFPEFDAFREPLLRAGINTSGQLCNRLLDETGVAILPGSDFGRDELEFTARLAYVNFDGSAALEAARAGGAVDEAFVREHCGETVKAVELMMQWLRQLPG